MNCRTTWTRRRSRRGSVLLYTVTMLVILGFIVLMVAQSVNHNIQVVRRSEERAQCFYAAEAGVQHVINWFEYPNLSPDPGYFEPFEDGKYLDANGNSSVTESRDIGRLGSQYLPVMQAISPARQIAYVSSLVISPPNADDPPGTIARVLSVGRTQTPTGNGDTVKATVEVLLLTNRIPAIVSPAAIISRDAGAVSNGQFNVHWGELWAKGDIHLNNPIDQKFPTESADPWYGARTEGWLRDHQGGSYADGRVSGGFTSTVPTAASPTYYQPFLEAWLHKDNKNKLNDHENLFQRQRDLDWPEYEYSIMKKVCQQRGFPIYRTTSDGRLIVGKDPNGQPIIKSFTEMFNTTRDPNTIPYEEMPPIYFIDTIDGNPPNGTNMATIEVNGGGPFFHGFFFIAANFKFGGSGNSPTINNPRLPGGDLPRESYEEDGKWYWDRSVNDVRLLGLLYSYGTADMSGGGDMFGSAYAKQGFTGGGSWHVYYDIAMGDADRNKIGSKVAFHLWNSY